MSQYNCLTLFRPVLFIWFLLLTVIKRFINKYIEFLIFKLKWFSVEQYNLKEFNKTINILKCFKHSFNKYLKTHM